MPKTPGSDDAPRRAIEQKIREAWDKGHLVVLWRDPVNVPAYIRLALRWVLRWPAPEIERHLTELLQSGRTVLLHETRERAEHYLSELHGFGLPATLERIS